MITVRRAEEKDTDRTMKLLSEVLELHAKLRPDIFISGKTKYTREELHGIFTNEETPVFVAADDNDEVAGCVLRDQAAAVFHQYEAGKDSVHRRSVR